MPKIKNLSIFTIRLIDLEGEEREKKIENVILREGLSQGINSLTKNLKEMDVAIREVTTAYRALDKEITKYKRRRDEKLNDSNTVIDLQ